MKLLDGLNEQQLQAVTSDSKHILCLAGAGTGKTRVLTHRIAHLNQNRIGVVNMAALTFTRLAGQEMKQRIVELIGDEGKKIFCNTFHAFCVKLIKEWGKVVKVEPNFTIYDQDDQKSIIQTIIDELGYTSKIKVKHVLHDIYNIRDGQPSELWSDESERAAKEYDYRLRQNNAIDLDGLLFIARDILRQQQPQDDYHNRFKYMFIDEFQDTNDVQMEIIELIDPENLFVVGDDFQSIYGWRGANVNLILNFSEMYPGCGVIKLERNYRSSASIVEAANNLISHNVKQTEKVLIAENGLGCVADELEFEDEEEEAEVVKQLVLRSLTHGNYSDFAILARTNRQLDTIKYIFEKNEVPVQLVQGKGDVFKKHDIRLILTAIEVALNPGDNYGLCKLLKFPYPRITQLELDECELKALDNEIPLLDVFENRKNNSPKIDELLRAFEILRSDTSNGVGILEVFAVAYLVTGARSYNTDNNLVNREDDYKEAVSQIYKWMSRRTDVGESTSPQAFLRWLRLRDIQEKLVEQQNAVKLMTVHAAKGLEFPSVFVIGMNQGVFPSKKCQDQEEERRLFYVAITRAKERLYITRPKTTKAPWNGQINEQEESQFLQEITTQLDSTAGAGL